MAAIDQIRAILREWHKSHRTLYVTVFDPSGMQTCAGHIAAVDEETAVISDARIDLHIPYASAGDRAVATLNHKTKSVTLTWQNGTSAFIVTRSVPKE
jgi:hypothetical protein